MTAEPLALSSMRIAMVHRHFVVIGRTPLTLPSVSSFAKLVAQGKAGTDSAPITGPITYLKESEDDHRERVRGKFDRRGGGLG